MPQLIGGQPRSERETIPAEVAWHPFRDLEIRHPGLAVQPYGRDLGHRQAQLGQPGVVLKYSLVAAGGVIYECGGAEVFSERVRRELRA